MTFEAQIEFSDKSRVPSETENEMNNKACGKQVATKKLPD